LEEILPAKRVFVSEIQRDTVVNDVFMVVRKGVYLGKNNARYMAVRLRDKTGSIEGRVWERVDELSSGFERNDLVRVEGKGRLFQDTVQLNVTQIQKVEGEMILSDMAAFYPECESSVQSSKEEFLALVDGIKEPNLVSLFSALKRRPDILEKFFALPAGVGIHHVSVGGLLEHSVSVAKMAKNIVPLTGADEDIAVAGCLLHDIGKTEELTVKGGFAYSDRGQLLGHVTLGVMILDQLVSEISEFPTYLNDILQHIIISHHGEAEWGSPKRPMCAEALIVHYLDNLDAKIMGVREHMRENMEDEKWTQYHRAYETRFYRLPER
jgi:3'-5' exoribonuclease